MIGGATAVATSVNAAGVGTWGGAAGSDIWLKPLADKANISIGYDILSEPQLGRTPNIVSFGGNKCSGSVTRYASYAYIENLFRSLLQGDITTTGSVAPWQHVIAYKEHGEVYGGHKYFWADYLGNPFQIDVTNSIVAKATLNMPSNSGIPQVAENWIGQAWTQAGAPSAPSISSFDLIRWPDLSLYLGGVEICNAGITLDLDSPIDDGDYGICSTVGRNRVSLLRNGLFSVSLTVERNMDTVDLAWILANMTGIGGYANNYILINNGAAGIAEREFKISLGTAYLKPLDVGLAKQGRITNSLAFDVRDTDDAGLIGMTFKNALSSIV